MTSDQEVAARARLSYLRTILEWNQKPQRVTLYLAENTRLVAEKLIAIPSDLSKVVVQGLHTPTGRLEYATIRGGDIEGISVGSEGAADEAVTGDEDG